MRLDNFQSESADDAGFVSLIMSSLLFLSIYIHLDKDYKSLGAGGNASVSKDEAP